MVLIKKITQHLRLILIKFEGQLQLASVIIRDLQGQLQLALTLPGTPQRPITMGEEVIIGPQQEKYNSENSGQSQKDPLGSLIWSSKSQKTKTYIRETSERHQGDELSLCPRRKKDINGGVGLTQMIRLKGLLIIPTLPMQRRVAK